MPKYLAVHLTVADANAEMLINWLKVAVRNAGGVLVASPGWTHDVEVVVEGMNNPTDRGVDYGDVKVIDLNDHV
jgi:hypothetical protein